MINLSEKASKELKEYLENVTTLMKKVKTYQPRKYVGFEELILDCGIMMMSKPLPDNIKLGLPKSCYYNAQRVALNTPNLIYCEGYAIAYELNFPLKHAWLMTPDKYAIDPTWEKPGLCYWGVPFNAEWVRSHLKARDRDDELSIFEGNHLENYSLLIDGLPEEALAR